MGGDREKGEKERWEETEKKKQKAIEDKTFGLKNKNKSKKVQQVGDCFLFVFLHDLIPFVYSVHHVILFAQIFSLFFHPCKTVRPRRQEQCPEYQCQKGERTRREAETAKGRTENAEEGDGRRKKLTIQ